MNKLVLISLISLSLLMAGCINSQNSSNVTKKPVKSDYINFEKNYGINTSLPYLETKERKSRFDLFTETQNISLIVENLSSRRFPTCEKDIYHNPEDSEIRSKVFINKKGEFQEIKDPVDWNISDARCLEFAGVICGRGSGCRSIMCQPLCSSVSIYTFISEFKVRLYVYMAFPPGGAGGGPPPEVLPNRGKVGFKHN